MIKKLNLFLTGYVKICEALAPQIVEIMRQFFAFFCASALIIILLSCQKQDFQKSELSGKMISKTKSFSGTGLLDTIGFTSVNPIESFDLLLNPGKGFVKYYDYEEQYADKFSTMYIRFDWSDIQPKANQYNWGAIDWEISQCIAEGKKFAFGIMCANTNRSINTPDKGKYVSPKWVFDAGAAKRTVNATYWETGQTIRQIVPVWTDSIFLSKLNAFVTTLGARYNGNPNIAFIDIRSYGNWGEQHLYELGGTALTSNQLKTLYIQPYKNAFPNTQLINPWGEAFYNDTYDWAVDQKIGMRSDGIFKYSTGSETVRAYQKAPSVFEYTANYDWLTSEGYWNPDTLLHYIEIGKPSYIQFDNAMYNANQALYTTVANKVGYHFVVKNVRFPQQIQSNQSFNVETSILNKGVTNIYENCHVAFALLDANNQVVQKRFLNSSHPQSWNPDQLTTEVNNVNFGSVANGTYKISVGLFSDVNDANPKIKFANTGKTTENWFVISNSLVVGGTVE